MKAVVVTPGTADLELIEMDPPAIASPTQVLVRLLKVGVCGTDRSVASGHEGKAPPGLQRLILGHEMLGTVSEVGAGVTAFKPGDLVVATVRRGCGQCPSCLQGRSDFCDTGLFREKGIEGEDGFMAQWIVEDEANLVPVPQRLADVGVLVEPLSTVEKALEQAVTYQRRVLPPCGHPEHGYDTPDWGIHKRALVAGAGPMGILGAFVLRSRGVETYVIARQPASSPKGRLMQEIGAHYVSIAGIAIGDLKASVGPVDMVLEATGAPHLPFSLIPLLARNGVMALVGIPAGTRDITVDGATMVREMVMANQALLGSVNAGPPHFQDAVRDLELFKERFGSAIEKVITETFPLERFQEPILHPTPESIKSVLDFGR